MNDMEIRADYLLKRVEAVEERLKELEPKPRTDTDILADVRKAIFAVCNSPEILTSGQIIHALYKIVDMT